MKITFRLIVSLVLAIATVAFGFTYYQVNVEQQRLLAELSRRAILMGNSLNDVLAPPVQANAQSKLRRIVERFGDRERLQGIAVIDLQGNIVVSTAELRSKLKEPVPQAVSALAEKRPIEGFVESSGKKTYVYTMPVTTDEAQVGALMIVHDASFIGVRLEEIWKTNLIRFVLLSLVVVAITLVMVRWSITGPIAQMAEWLRELRSGRGRESIPQTLPKGDILSPIITEAAKLAKSLALAQAQAQEEARLRMQSDSLWTDQRLREHVRHELKGQKLYVLSNREPYMHVKQGRTVKCITPAGGLVTALDPVMRICDGLWIAHGSGDADREMVDERSMLRVPPDEPAYSLKRVWLTKEEENGYYYGFSNEGLWPLCHITHTRPTFRLDDWTAYQQVNQHFADALIEEIADEDSPLILIQDYQLAILPLLVRERRPDARIAIFWHIPWPNPEAYGICPWRAEVLLGMLGADLIGFHTQFHCNNFLDTVDRFLESKTNWERFSVARSGHTTLVKPFPISVAFNGEQRSESSREKMLKIREEILKEIAMNVHFLGIGVDRIDYTKGIPERFMAIERFFEKHPEYIGEFTFVELAAPSRTHIKKYRDLMVEVDEMVERINWKLQTKWWKPIVYLKANHSHDEVYRYYKAADICMVTSLHDGMNLVAKEYVTSRVNDDGVLILSQFAGASNELREALLVNPYDIEETADAIFTAITMEAEQQRERMSRMRGTIRENNVYRWAGDLITTLARLSPLPAVHE
jgi:trehalose 6-phosphate synthase